METITGSSFWFVFSACIGGIIVLVGLLMEVLAEKEKYKNITDFHCCESTRKWGEWFVISGIVVEVVVAGLVAKDEWQSDSRNKPIANASAIVRLIISQDPRNPLFTMAPDDGFGWNLSMSFINGTSLIGSTVLLRLKASQSDAAGWNMGSDTNREWRIAFHEDPFDFLSSESDRNKILVKQFDAVKALILAMPFETNMVVESGSVLLTVNNFKWTFDIPKQKPKWGIISMQIVIDSTGHLIPQVLRVPISDFVSPPRFTNRIYDGK